MEPALGWHAGFAASLLAAGFWYARGAKAAGITRGRQTAFFAALGLAGVVLVGPLPLLAVQYFWAHMVQHILLMMLISPLAVLGSPGRVVVEVHRLPERLPRLRSLAFLCRPVVGFAIFFTVLIATHFSPLANAGMVEANIHSLELVLFLAGGLIYYYPLFEGNPTPFPIPHPVRVASLFLMMIPETMTGFFMYASSGLLHDVRHHESMGAFDPLYDQQLGGALMWSLGMIIDTVWVVVAAVEFFAAEKLKGESGVI